LARPATELGLAEEGARDATTAPVLGYHVPHELLPGVFVHGKGMGKSCGKVDEEVVGMRPERAAQKKSHEGIGDLPHENSVLALWTGYRYRRMTSSRPRMEAVGGRPETQKMNRGSPVLQRTKRRCCRVAPRSPAESSRARDQNDEWRLILVTADPRAISERRASGRGVNRPVYPNVYPRSVQRERYSSVATETTKTRHTLRSGQRRVATGTKHGRPSLARQTGGTAQNGQKSVRSSLGPMRGEARRGAAPGRDEGRKREKEGRWTVPEDEVVGIGWTRQVRQSFDRKSPGGKQKEGVQLRRESGGVER